MSIVLSLLLACGGSTRTPPASAPEPTSTPALVPEPEPAPTEELPVAWKLPLTAAMHEHFDHATDSVYNVILGDLEQVKVEGRSLAAAAAPELPESWKPQFDAMKEAAAAVAESPDLDAAADRVVAVGQACADCHSLHGGPQLTAAEAAGSGWPNEDSMSRHQWAAYLMWLGVILPSEEVFVTGTQQLAHEDAIPPVPERAMKLEQRVHALAAAAAAAKDPVARAEVYAGFLRTCAACHGAALVFEGVDSADDGDSEDTTQAQ